MRNGSESFPCGEYLYWNDAEKGLLSSMMQDPNRAIPLGLRRVSATHFFVPAHQTIFTELCTAYRQRGTFDLIVFTEHLRQVGQIDQVGGPAFVTELFTFAPTAANIEYYIDIVQDKYLRRQMIEAATATIRMAQEEQEDIRALLQVAQQNLERFRLLASGRFDNVEDFPFADLLAFDPKADADNLLGHRWLCRGSTCLWAGAAGVGKSSLEMQLAIYWGCGLPCFRVTPVRPLKSLIIQAENDLGDTGEQLQGVIEGISKADDIELADVERRDQVQRNVVIVRVIGTTGKKFCALLESLLDLHKPDLVWIDPLFAFAGCDLRDAKEVGLFLREGLIPIAVRHRVCVHVIHHVGKPDRDSKAKSSWTDLDFQYLGFGSSEIQNAFRAVNVILPVSGEEKVFRLIFSKRGKRAGAKSPDGEFTTNIYLTHAKEGIYWLQVGRAKNYLTEAEVERFLQAARWGRHGVRNFAMLLIAFRHGLRVSELINIRMADVDLDTGRLFVRRLKGSLSTSQPLEGDEIRALRAWLRQRANAPCCNSPLVFLSERGPMTRQAFNYICTEIGKRAGLSIKVHPHMLRHSCGYALANKGCDTRLIQDYLGHRNIRHTQLYTRTAAVRFERLWR